MKFSNSSYGKKMSFRIGSKRIDSDSSTFEKEKNTSFFNNLGKNKMCEYEKKMLNKFTRYKKGSR